MGETLQSNNGENSEKVAQTPTTPDDKIARTPVKPRFHGNGIAKMRNARSAERKPTVVSKETAKSVSRSPSSRFIDRHARLFSNQLSIEEWNKRRLLRQEQHISAVPDFYKHLSTPKKSPRPRNESK